MANKQHTPAPWFMDTSLHIYGTAKPVPMEGGGEIIDQPHVCTAKNWSDAALIVAAPEMLAMLRKMYAVEMNPDVSAELIALIEKAEGKQS